MRHTKFESEFLKYCKKYKVPLDWSVQGELHFNQIFLDEDLQEELKNKKCLIWLKNNQKGEEYGIIRNQVYIASNDTSIVYKSLKLTFEEVFHIWESYEKGHSLEWIEG